MSYTGSLIIKPLSGQLTQDTETFGKMYPYVKVVVGTQFQQTPPHKHGGKHPEWDTSLNFKHNSEDIIAFEVWDRDSSNDFIGEGEIAFATVVNSNNRFNDWVDLKYKGKKAGRILVYVEYTPDLNSIQNQQTSFQQNSFQQNSYQQPSYQQQQYIQQPIIQNTNQFTQQQPLLQNTQQNLLQQELLYQQQQQQLQYQQQQQQLLYQQQLYQQQQQQQLLLQQQNTNQFTQQQQYNPYQQQTTQNLTQQTQFNPYQQQTTTQNLTQQQYNPYQQQQTTQQVQYTQQIQTNPNSNINFTYQQ